MRQKANSESGRGYNGRRTHLQGPGRVCDGGSSLLEMAFLVPILLTMLVGVIDFGRAYYLSIEVSNAASAGALYGSQSTTTAQDSSGMHSAALSAAPNVSGLSATGSTYCECYGSTGTVSCSNPGCSGSSHVIQWVQVNASATYTPLIRYPGVPSSFSLQSESTVRVSE